MLIFSVNLLLTSGKDLGRLSEYNLYLQMVKYYNDKLEILKL